MFQSMRTGEMSRIFSNKDRAHTQSLSEWSRGGGSWRLKRREKLGYMHEEVMDTGILPSCVQWACCLLFAVLSVSFCTLCRVLAGK